MGDIVAFALSHEHVEMIWHETVREESNTACVVFEWFRDRPSLPGVSRKVGRSEVEMEIAEESFVVGIVLENCAFFYPTIVDVVVGTWTVLFDTMFRRH